MSERKTAEDWAHDLAHHSGTGPLVFTAHATKVLTAAMAQEYERGQEAALEGLAPHFAQLRHLYDHMVNGRVLDPAEAARGLLGPAIAAYERALPTKPAPEPAPGCPPHDPVFHDGDANSWCARCGHFPMPLDGARSLGPRFPPDPTRERGGEE